MDHYSTPAKAQGLTLASFMNWVYLWMALGLFLSAAVAYGVSTNPDWQLAILQNQAIFLVLVESLSTPAKNP